MCRDTAVMNDGPGGPAALATVHATVRDGNYALSTGTWKRVTYRKPVRARLAVLDPLTPAWRAVRTSACARWWTR